MKYTFIEEIGYGGFGVVQKVQNDKGETLAKKTFRINQGPNFPAKWEDNVKKRFIREAKVQSAIDHKNIVQVVDKDLNIDPPFFVMPLAVKSLQDDIQKERTLNGNFMDAVMDIIAALEELHLSGIYHRDLKPANVLRFKSDIANERDYYAIGDFGLMSINQTNISTLTQTGMQMGSDYYTAPEIVADFSKASAQCDIYSLGCILHDFVGNDVRIPCNEIKDSSEFSSILLACTRKDPSRRFRSVSALRDALVSLGEVKLLPKTDKGIEIFTYFEKTPDEISEREWESIITFISDNEGTADSDSALHKINIPLIEELVIKSSDLSARLGLLYANWIRNNSFSFNDCDALSMRLQKFVDNCDIEVQSDAIMAMLYMGTSHNRWYVEEKFARLVDKNMNENLAKRIAIEIRVDEEKACRAIRHLTMSIRFNVDNFHPLIKKAFNEVCK